MKKILAAALLVAMTVPAGAANAKLPPPPKLPTIDGPGTVEWVSKIPYGVMTQACESEFWFVPNMCM